MTREALRRGGPRSMSPPKSHAVALRTTSMPKRSKSSGDAPVEPTPDVEAPASDGAAAERARSAARKTGPEMRGGQDQHRGEPAHPGVPLAPPGIVPESDVRVHTPAAAAPLPAHGLVNEGLGELPWAYGDARLVGLVRDPTTLFIYWDFSQQQIEQAFAGLGSARAVIKLWNARNGGGAPGATASGRAVRAAGSVLPAPCARPADHGRNPGGPAAQLRRVRSGGMGAPFAAARVQRLELRRTFRDEPRRHASLERDQRWRRR